MSSDCIVGEVSSTRLRSKTVGLARNGYNVVGIVAGVLNTYMMNPLAVRTSPNFDLTLTFLVELEGSCWVLLGKHRSATRLVTFLMILVRLLLWMFGLGVFPTSRVQGRKSTLLSCFSVAENPSRGRSVNWIFSSNRKYLLESSSRQKSLLTRTITRSDSRNFSSI